ncbi:hypothetical protein C8Q75DRAFT_409209 [Abortiporus biennis]|nr:hypothetical protein C8Q75DRAFT_409209 [Abortiporus biennis]
MDHSPCYHDQLIQAKNIVDFADVMILIFANISSRMDVLALMHSRKSLYSLGIPRLLTGFTIEICNTFHLASFCQFMHGFLSENKFFYLRQISILISISFAFSNKLPNIIRGFHRLLENATFLETLCFENLEGWIVFDPDLYGVLLSLTKLTSLHLYHAGDKSFGIIHHHSSNLRSLRVEGYTVSKDVQSETFTKLSLNIRQLHISRLPNLVEIQFLQAESLVLSASPRVQLPLLIKSFPNISSLTYNSSYIEDPLSPRLTHIALTFNLKALSAESVLPPTIEPMDRMAE